MKLKEFIDKCLGDHLHVIVTEPNDDLRTERMLVENVTLLGLRRYPVLMEREIECFTIMHEKNGLCWCISLKRN